jgi:hypothetical protein
MAVLPDVKKKTGRYLCKGHFESRFTYLPPVFLINTRFILFLTGGKTITNTISSGTTGKPGIRPIEKQHCSFNRIGNNTVEQYQPISSPSARCLQKRRAFFLVLLPQVILS